MSIVGISEISEKQIMLRFRSFQIVAMADEKQFVLLVVRHGQGTHNLGEDNPG